MQQLEAHIKIDPNQTVSIEDINGQEMSIDVKNKKDIQTKLEGLDNIQLDGLRQIVEKEKGKLSHEFIEALEKIVSKKNIAGNFTNVKYVSIGDKIHYHIHQEAKYSKELTLNIPKTHKNDIIGRDEELQSLHELLNGENKVVVVNGLGGVGKTTLVQVFLFKYYNDYEHIAWVTQNAETSISNTFNNASGLIQNLHIDNSNTESETVFKEIIRKLKNITDKPNLLIIDNAEQSLKEYKNLLPGHPHWHLLITSREEIPGFCSKQLGFLSKEQGIQLFKRHYTLDILSDSEIEALIDIIYCHTLLIEVLAKTATLRRYDFSILKTAIEKNLETKIENGKIEKIGSLLSSMFSITKLSNFELWILKQFVCLPSEFISYNLLYELTIDPIKTKNDLYSETLNNILSKGWLTYSNDSYKMHKIVIDVIKKDQQLTIGDISVLLDKITKRLEKDETRDNPVEKFKWIPFGKAIIDSFNNEVHPKIAMLQNNLAIILRDNGYYEEAKIYIEKALQCFESIFGKQHPISAKANVNFGIIYKDLMDLKNAKVYLEDALSYYEAKDGITHYRTGYCYSKLSSVYQEQGEYKKAASFAQKALTAYNTNFKQDHPYIIDQNSVLGLLHCKLGNFAAAKSLLEKALRINEQNFGADHPRTVESYINMGVMFKEIGNYDDAKFYFEKALNFNLRNFGKTHPATIRLYANLASLIKTSVNPKNEKEELQDKYYESEDLQNKNHNEIDNNLTVFLKDVGKLNESKLLLEKKIENDSLKYGADYFGLASPYSQLSHILQELEEFEKAKLYAEKAIVSYKQNFDATHPFIIAEYTSLASINRELGDLEKAQQLFQLVIKANIKTFGKDHPVTAISFANLAMLLSDKRNFEGAKKLFEKALQSNLKNFGKEHHKTGETYNYLGCVYQQLNDFINAKILLEIAVSITEKNFGKDDYRTVICYNNLASVLYDNEDYKDAKGFYQLVARYYEINFGKKDTKTALIYSDLSLVLDFLGEKEKALELSKKSLAILKKNLSDTDPNLILVQNNYEFIKEYNP